MVLYSNTVVNNNIVIIIINLGTSQCVTISIVIK